MSGLRQRQSRSLSRFATGASALVAAVGTLALAVTAGWFVPAALGVVAGGCLAGAVHATAVAERRAGTLLSGWLAALAGIGAGAGVLAATVLQTPWPPVPPIPFLASAPFVFVLAGVLTGFGAIASAGGLFRVTVENTGVAGRRVYVVGLVPTTVAFLGAPLLPGALFTVLLVLSVVVVLPWAVGTSPSERLRSVIPPVGAVVTGLTLVAATIPVYRPLEAAAIRAATSEGGRQYLVQSFDFLGPYTVTVGVVGGALVVSASLLLVVWLAGWLRLLSDPVGVPLASAGTLVAAIAAGISGVHPLAVFCGVAVSLLAWDLGEFAVTLGRELGRVGRSRRVELVHTVGAVALAGIGVLVAAGTVSLASRIPSTPTAVSVVATLMAATGAFLLFLAVR